MKLENIKIRRRVREDVVDVVGIGDAVWHLDVDIVERNYINNIRLSFSNMFLIYKLNNNKTYIKRTKYKMKI